MFWVLARRSSSSNFATAAVSIHLIPYLVDIGYSATQRGHLIGWMGAMQVPGRMLFVPISVASRRALDGRVGVPRDRRWGWASCRSSR